MLPIKDESAQRLGDSVQLNYKEFSLPYKATRNQQKRINNLLLQGDYQLHQSTKNLKDNSQNQYQDEQSFLTLCNYGTTTQQKKKNSTNSNNSQIQLHFAQKDTSLSKRELHKQIILSQNERILYRKSSNTSTASTSRSNKYFGYSQKDEVKQIIHENKKTEAEILHRHTSMPSLNDYERFNHYQNLRDLTPSSKQNSSKQNQLSMTNSKFHQKKTIPEIISPYNFKQYLQLLAKDPSSIEQMRMKLNEESNEFDKKDQSSSNNNNNYYNNSNNNNSLHQISTNNFYNLIISQNNLNSLHNLISTSPLNSKRLKSQQQNGNNSHNHIQLHHHHHLQNNFNSNKTINNFIINENNDTKSNLSSASKMLNYTKASSSSHQLLKTQNKISQPTLNLLSKSFKNASSKARRAEIEPSTLQNFPETQGKNSLLASQLNINSIGSSSNSQSREEVFKINTILSFFPDFSNNLHCLEIAKQTKKRAAATLKKILGWSEKMSVILLSEDQTEIKKDLDFQAAFMEDVIKQYRISLKKEDHFNNNGRDDQSSRKDLKKEEQAVSVPLEFTWESFQKYLYLNKNLTAFLEKQELESFKTYKKGLLQEIVGIHSKHSLSLNGKPNLSNKQAEYLSQLPQNVSFILDRKNYLIKEQAMDNLESAELNLGKFPFLLSHDRIRTKYLKESANVSRIYEKYV